MIFLANKNLDTTQVKMAWGGLHNAFQNANLQINERFALSVEEILGPASGGRFYCGYAPRCRRAAIARLILYLSKNFQIMRFLFLFLLVPVSFYAQTPESEINEVLNAWHKAAADADFDAYFGKMTGDSVFLGTDATENWDYEAFKAFSKPYFNRGKAWSFFDIRTQHIFE